MNIQCKSLKETWQCEKNEKVLEIKSEFQGGDPNAVSLIAQYWSKHLLALLQNDKTNKKHAKKNAPNDQDRHQLRRAEGQFWSEFQ